MQSHRMGSSSILWAFILCLFVRDSVVQNVCDDTGAPYAPYIRVYKKKNGPVLKELDSTGFMDLRYFTGVSLCINGP